jgi:hypothetical protein
VSLPSSYRSRRGQIHLLRVLPLVGCRSKTPTVKARDDSDVWKFELSVFVSAKNIIMDIRIRIRF